VNARSELADLLADVVPQFHEYADAFGEIANALLAAGYRKQDATLADEDEPDHEGWDRRHFDITGCDGSMHASGECLETWMATK